jgi:hypothetical protein
VCKFAPKKSRFQIVVCDLYTPKAVTCNVDDGGPFVGSFAYCGHFNVLCGWKHNLKKYALRVVKPVLVEA